MPLWRINGFESECKTPSIAYLLPPVVETTVTSKGTLGTAELLPPLPPLPDPLAEELGEEEEALPLDNAELGVGVGTTLGEGVDVL